MKTQHIDINTPDGVCDAFVAYPGDGVYPAVIFYMDAFGPRDYLYEMVQKLASHGYFVLLPNVFYRSKHAPIIDMKFPLQSEQLPAAFDVFMPMVHSITPELAARDAGVFLEFLSQQKHADTSKVGVTGYCMGGRLSLRAAAKYPKQIVAAASFHAGHMATSAQDSPHLEFPNIKAELYIGHADEDPSMPVEQIQRLQSALEASHLRYKTELYTGAKHSFAMADLPAYNKAALEHHWECLLDLFKRNLLS